MKMITLVALILAMPAMAKQSKETIHTTTTVDVHEFSCITPVAGQVTYTQVGNGRLFLGTPEGVELKYTSATAQGCAMDALSQVNDKAMRTGFGFLHSVPLTVTKETGESRKLDDGSCVASYNEKIELDLGFGVIVSSEQGIVRQATDCN